MTVLTCALHQRADAVLATGNFASTPSTSLFNYFNCTGHQSTVLSSTLIDNIELFLFLVQKIKDTMDSFHAKIITQRMKSLCCPRILIPDREEKLLKIHSDYPSAKLSAEFQMFFYLVSRSFRQAETGFVVDFTDRPPWSCEVNTHHTGMIYWNQR